MENRTVRVDLRKLLIYILKRIWLVILFTGIGYGLMYYRTSYHVVPTYSASGTMYVYNSNPNLVNYQYTSTNDLNSAVQLIDTYLVVVKSNKVMDVVAERLAADYEGINADYIAMTLSMASVSETGVVQVISTTTDPKLSMDIVNAVLDVAPVEIIRVVGAGGIEIVDYAQEPVAPNVRNSTKYCLMGAMAGCLLAAGILVLLFMMNRKVADTEELERYYTPPVLASIRRIRREGGDAGAFLLTSESPMDIIEGYAKLRMNLLYAMAARDNHLVVVSSAISGEGKSTITANLAISCAMSGKKVLLVDADLRRACQKDIFGYDSAAKGVSGILARECTWQEAVMKDIRENLDLLPAGQYPPNPAELLGSPQMQELLKELEAAYDLVLLDMPPINIVSDPLVLSSQVAGCLFVIRQNYSDHRDIRKSMIAAEMTGMNIMGLIFYGEKIHDESYYSRRNYKYYYHNYDYRRRPASTGKREEDRAAGEAAQTRA